jgi:hypothetical protein
VLLGTLHVLHSCICILTCTYKRSWSWSVLYRSVLMLSVRHIFAHTFSFVFCCVISFSWPMCWRIVFSQSTLPIRAEVNIKISGAQCNLIISRIKPLILFKSAKKKPLVLHEIPQQEKAPKEKLPLALVLAFSAPELSVVVYSLEDIPLFHVSSYHVLCSTLHVRTHLNNSS